MTKTWLITGCSSGFGKILANAALSRGDNVVVTARNPNSLSDFVERHPKTAKATALDVTKAGAAAEAVALAEKTFGGLDILVNNAGYGFIGSIEETTPGEYRPTYETNVFGLIETTRAALPALRKRGSGRIVNISSGAGIVGAAGFGVYNGTKFAVEGLSEALALEVAPLGIAVIIVEPGPFRTEFLGRSINSSKVELPAYTGTVGLARSYRDNNNGKQVGDPEKAIAVILKAIDADRPPLHLPLGKRAYAIIRGKFEAFTADMDAWEAEAIATDFD